MPSNKHCANIAFHRIKKSGLAPVTLLSKNDSWAMTRRVWFEIGFHLYIHTQQTSIVCKARPFSKFHYVHVCFKCVGSVTFDLPQTLRSSKIYLVFWGYSCEATWRHLYYSEITARVCLLHYTDVIMGAIASQITNLTIVYSTIYSSAD